MRKIILFPLFGYLTIFPFGQLARFPLLIPDIHLYLTDVAVAGLVGSFLFWKLLKREKISLPPLGKPVILFTILALLSLIVNTPLFTSREVGIAFLYLLRWAFYAGVYFVVSDLAQRQKIKNQKIFNFLIITGLVTALFGLLQYFTLPDTRFLQNYGWDPHYYRAIGTFFDPGFLGMILVLTIVLLTVKIWPIKRVGRWEISWLIVYLALALTYSRASYLAYLAGMGIIAWAQKSPKFFLGVLLVGMMTVALLPRPGGEGVRLERQSTILFRLINWERALIVSYDHPILGVGFNTYRYTQEQYGFLTESEASQSHSGAGVDSSLLFVLATTGLLGLVSYLWLWKGILGTGDLIVVSSGVALLIHSFFTNTLFYPWVMGWLWILLGVSEVKKKK